MRLVVLSDDFTGALDTGVQFAGTGVETVVTTLHADGSLPAAQRCTVLVVDTESRHLTAEAAGARVRDTVLRIRHGIGVDAQAELPGDPRILWYKKTDSLLRGNIGSELAALMDAAGGGELAFVPAFPATGRTTTGGVQYLDGVPIDRTPFAPDQLNPIRSARVPFY